MDMLEVATSLVNVQAAGVRAGLQAGDIERERLQRELKEALYLLIRVTPLAKEHIYNEPHFEDEAKAVDEAYALLTKHGLLPA